MSDPCHYLMSPRRCTSDVGSAALSVNTASEFSRYSGVIPTPIKGDADGANVYQALDHRPSDQLSRDGYILHPAYGWLPAETPYLALLAARVAS